MHKFKVNDVVKSKLEDNCFFKIREVYGDCYDAINCDKYGNVTGVASIDIWFDNSLADEGYAVEVDFEKIS